MMAHHSRDSPQPRLRGGFCRVEAPYSDLKELTLAELAEEIPTTEEDEDDDRCSCAEGEDDERPQLLTLHAREEAEYFVCLAVC
jgi:hypothetical protein